MDIHAYNIISMKIIITISFLILFLSIVHAQNSDLSDSLDSDEDGLSDYQEQVIYKTHFNNRDTDKDGLTDGDEIIIHNTNPLFYDSDGDGLNDGDEIVKYKTNPLAPDSDFDALSDFDEIFIYTTKVLIKDTDNDGLLDGIEILSQKTNPKEMDTDLDGLKDGEEIYVYNTNPLIADSDKDGLDDGLEINQHKTDPTDSDSDNDMLTDGDEISIYKTNPNKADTDGDTLTDGDEVYVHKTNPNELDSDKDGTSDAAEIHAKSDPLNPFIYPSHRYYADKAKLPAIIIPPVNKKASIGDSVIFRIECRNGRLKYKWIKLGEGIIHNENNTLSFDRINNNNTGYYVVIISNEHGYIYSSPFALTLYDRPNLTIASINGKELGFQISGKPLTSYIIQYSYNFNHWSSMKNGKLRTSESGLTTSKVIVDSMADKKFFRLKKEDN